MAMFEGLLLPSIIEIESYEKDTLGRANDVYLCSGKFLSKACRFVLKVSKRDDLELFNEYRILEAVVSRGGPAPRPLFKGESGRAYIVQEFLEGRVIWDHVDPRRSECDPDTRLHYLSRYGEALARIHALSVSLHVQKRAGLYLDYARRLPRQDRYEPLLDLLAAHAPDRAGMDYVLTHGDFNISNVLVSCGEVSGVLDWEFAGKGWREYDIAYAMHARPTFLNTEADRQALLSGYRETGRFDEHSLAWCEVVNYLHYANHCERSNVSAADFFLTHAERCARRLEA